MQHPGDSYWSNDSQSYLFQLLGAEKGGAAAAFQFQQHIPNHHHIPIPNPNPNQNQNQNGFLHYCSPQTTLICSGSTNTNTNSSTSCCCDYKYNNTSCCCQLSGGGSVSNSTTASGTPQDRAYAALQNHKEAEKRRRERINSHLDKLRALLPCNSKTDKATLLAKVVERVKELKEAASGVQGLDTFPSEVDEITVTPQQEAEDDDNQHQHHHHHHHYRRGRPRMVVYKASVCCEERSELLPELIEILKSLNLKTVRAEMVTIGGRTRNVLMLAPAAGDEDDESESSIHFLENALNSLLQRNASSSTPDPSKRRRLIQS